MRQRLPAEWEPLDGVLLAWPHADSDWAPYLQAAEDCVGRIAAAISHCARVLVLTQQPEQCRLRLQQQGVLEDQLLLIEHPLGDTWCRDYGPISLVGAGGVQLLDWVFNGWGGKYPAERENACTRLLYQQGLFAPTSRLHSLPLVLEGGAIDSDGRGTLLSTASCLFDAQRNPHLKPQDLVASICQHCAAQRLLILENGALEGDDTDGHIDTLARFGPGESIVYVRCEAAEDSHYQAFAAMERELQALRTLDGRPYRLIPLPWPQPIYAADGHRLPATYANFLWVNGRLLVPTYGDPADQRACAVLAEAFPEYLVQGIDCRVLIEQHGSLHCMTMQLPQGSLAPKGQPTS